MSDQTLFSISDLEVMVPYLIQQLSLEDDSPAIWESNDFIVDRDFGVISDYHGKLLFVVEHGLMDFNHLQEDTPCSEMSRVICGNVIGYVYSDRWFCGRKLVIMEDDKETTDV